MAANDYYNSHPESSQSNLHPSFIQSTSYDPYRQSSPSPQPIPIPSQTTSNQHLSPSNISPGPYHSTSAPQSANGLTPEPSGYSSDTACASDRGIFSSSSSNSTKKSKSERAIKFVEKQVKKQIEKKVNGHGGGGHGQQIEEQLNQAFTGEQQGQGAGEYGAIGSGDYGFGNGAAGGGGEYGFGESVGYGPPQGAFGENVDMGNFEFSGGGGGWLEDLGLDSLGDAGA